MTPIEEFIDIMHTPDGIPSPALVRKLEEEYPFFVMPAALTLSRNGEMLDRTEAERLRAFVALNSSDPSMLYRLTGEYGCEFTDFYNEADQPPVRPATEDAIESFLERYGTPDDPEETALLERLIFHPVADYASQLAAAEDSGEVSAESDDSPESLSRILSDIADISADEVTVPSEAPAPARIPEIPPVDTTFSESLAKIYVRQHKFDKAYEIISNLSLKYPEKSCYFADQMRFLQKLILNDKYNT